MSHLNILTISREIESIKKNINNYQGVINENSNTHKEMSECIRDLNDIKANKIDITISLDEIKNDFKFLEQKLKMINKNVSHILSRDLDYINKDNRRFVEFLRTQFNLDQKKINIILYVLDCTSPEQFILLDDTDLYEFGFSEADISSIKKGCKEEMEKNAQEFV